MCDELAAGVASRIPHFLYLAKPVADTLGSAAVPGFEDFDGGTLQSLLIQQATVVRGLRDLAGGIQKGVQARAAEYQAAEANFSSVSATEKWNCSDEAFQEAIDAGKSCANPEWNLLSGAWGDQNEYGWHMNCDNTSWSGGPLVAQFQRCQDLKTQLAPAQAQTVMEQTGSAHALRVAFFDRFGRRIGDAIDGGAGAQPSQAADPVLAPLSADGSTFALAFGDLAQGVVHVALRTVSPNGPGSVVYASSDSSIPVDQDPDLLWTGSDMVAVWASGIVGAGPELRRFNANLVAAADQQALGTSGGSPALASFEGSWAVAWRGMDSSGLETIEVRTANASWSVGPFEPGAALERPALAELDSSHLLVVFTEGTDPLSTGTSNVTRLGDAVLDLGAQGTTPPMDVPVSLDPWASDDTLSQSRPALARSGSRLYLAWQTESPVGDPRVDEVFSREIGWGGVTLSLLPEIPLQADAPRAADQDAPAIAGTPLGPEGALVTVWEDSTAEPLHTMLPDLVFGLRPTPIVELGPLDGGA